MQLNIGVFEKGGYRKLTFAHVRQAQRCVRCMFEGSFSVFSISSIKTGLDTYLIRMQTRTLLSRYPLMIVLITGSNIGKSSLEIGELSLRIVENSLAEIAKVLDKMQPHCTLKAMGKEHPRLAAHCVKEERI